MNSLIPWWTAPWSRSVQFTRSKNFFQERLARAAMTAAIALGMGPLALVPVRAQAPADNNAAAPQIQVDSSPLARSTGALTSFAPIVEKVTPSIVTVSTIKKVSTDPNAFQGNPMLRRFFGIPEGPEGGDEGGSVEGLGSGVIVSSDGLILTNNHVAEAGDKIQVQIGEHGRKYQAKVVGNDPTSDLALLKIDAKNLPVLTFADSDQVKVGDIALAVGNPFALTDTVTMGIVSALGRNAVLDGDGDGSGVTHYEDFIQTDASINPGNSGGALVDTEGRLIGINTAIYSRTGANNGIGFAVPSNLARDVIASLLKYGKVNRGYLGAVVQELNPDLAEQFKVPDTQEGALISQLLPGSAAEKAGLQSGDIITAVNGKAINDPMALRLTVGGMRAGDQVTLTYLRDGQSKTASVTLGGEGNTGEVAETSPQQQNDHPNVLDGITVGDLDDSSRSDLKVPTDVKGVLVSDVSSDSVGYDAGLRKNDIILQMNHKLLTSADQAVDEGNKIAKEDKVLLQVWSSGRTEFMVLKPRE